MEHATPSVALYTKVLGGLLLLTLLTFVQPSLLPLAVGGTVGIQLLIAAMKVALVAAYYMHLRSETAYLKGYVGMALVILLVFFVIVGIDVAHS
ncbi:cytochrome C oxidase subunit IV family protein [Sulfurimonas sp. HSL-3221]|uniref:cytochrome C oxidase subunit IV family protein n=1 Tax=Sulfurimonadaceae TaxID=2771471 RepID=UPI001E46526B|nr:cytochrome C oxidase subunit IV family protein [Sulfurimonas sp. HSL-3221]UFS62879.1 cytochrome C oxidase subunit IV family protein [Sulfurimonas sp. HSL-3221]